MKPLNHPDWESAVWEPDLTSERATYTPPAVVTSHSVVQISIADARAHPHSETGQAHIGIAFNVVNGENPFADPPLAILGMIPPREEETTRHAAQVSLGDESQRDAFQWWRTVWNAKREKSRAAPNYPSHQWRDPVPEDVIPRLFDTHLRHLGDTHKHPGGLSGPSGGDLMTAIDLLNELEFLILPIVTMERNWRWSFGWRDDRLTGSTGEAQARISYSFLSRRMLNLGIRSFAPIRPLVVPDDWLPVLPPLPWNLTNPQQLEEELILLRGYGAKVRCFNRQIGENPLPKICFAVGRPDWDNNLLVITEENYPIEPPEVRILPREDRTTEEEPEASAGNASWFERRLTSAAVRYLKRRSPNLEFVEGNRRAKVFPQAATGETGPIELPWGPHQHLLNLVMTLDAQGRLRCPPTT